jgi:hypothetical protein
VGISIASASATGEAWNSPKGGLGPGVPFRDGESAACKIPEFKINNKRADITAKPTEDGGLYGVLRIVIMTLLLFFAHERDLVS